MFHVSSHESYCHVIIDPPRAPLPDECCSSGCSNCVWISYAEALSDYYSDNGEAGLKVIKSIKDPSLRTFLELEWKLKFGT